jgi:hypothetical protein
MQRHVMKSLYTVMLGSRYRSEASVSSALLQWSLDQALAAAIALPTGADIRQEVATSKTSLELGIQLFLLN